MTPGIPCKVCGGSGFSGRGTGYDDVCGECGGLKYFPLTSCYCTTDGRQWCEERSDISRCQDCPLREPQTSLCPRCKVNRIDRVLLGTEAEGHICGACWATDRIDEPQTPPTREAIANIIGETVFADKYHTLQDVDHCADRILALTSPSAASGLPPINTDLHTSEMIDSIQRRALAPPSSPSSPPLLLAPHNSGERLPNSDVADGGGETTPSAAPAGEPQTPLDRQKLIDLIGYRFGALVSGNNMPDMSGDPRARIGGTRRRRFDNACAECADAILALRSKHD